MEQRRADELLTSLSSCAEVPITNRPPRRPRDAQRSRVYLAETPLPSSPLPGLDACASFVDKVVGSLWWLERFPERDLGGAPRLRPGNGARQAFYREEESGPTITLPRRYRTKAVVLHELSHWALGIDSGLPHHGRTFARVLLDAVHEFCGPERGTALATSYREHGVHVGKPPRHGPDGRLHYGWDERLRLGKGHPLRVSFRDAHGTPAEHAAVFVGYARGSSVLRFADGTHLATADVWAVADA
jgi:putative metallohydrolase (TIGR04338 family)